MVIFYSYVKLPEGIHVRFAGPPASMCDASADPERWQGAGTKGHLSHRKKETEKQLVGGFNPSEKY